MKKNWFILLSLLSLVTALIWYSVISYPRQTMQIIACDVGQGDALLITLKDFQILVDGGPGSSVLECLSDYIPFWDRQIEVVILSHPQKDHFGGLIEVFKKYSVKYLLTTPIDSGSQEWSVLKDLVGGSSTNVVNPHRGDKYRFGLIYLDILHPSEDFLLANSGLIETPQDNFIASGSGGVMGVYTSTLDPNDFSIVAVLSFGNLEVLLTGDIGPKVSEIVVKELLINFNQGVEYIKIPHHGSKNGLTDELLKAARPEIAVISAGKNNSYGHPHKEVLEMLNSYGVRVFRTDEVGDVVFESDGESIWLKNN